MPKNVLDDTNWSEKAWMSRLDADLLECLIRVQIEKNNQKLKFLEWGSGKSTLYYTQLVDSLCSDYYWVSVEYNKEYFKDSVLPLLNRDLGYRVYYSVEDLEREAPVDGLNFVVLDHGSITPHLEGYEEHRTIDMTDYVEVARSCTHKFDMVLVDGRKRRKCVAIARQFLRDGGVTLLHDSYRNYYHEGFAKYNSVCHTGDILMAGSDSDTSSLNALLNKVYETRIEHGMIY